MMLRANLFVVAAVALALAACGSDSPEARLAAAKAHLAKDENSAAVIELKNALQKNPKLAEARLLLGTALLEMNDPAGAEAELRRALEYGAAASDVTAPIARAMVSQGKFKDVVDQYGSVQLEGPESQLQLATALGEAQLNLLQVDAAQRELDKALKLRPDYAPALLVSARLKGALGDYASALEFTRKAIDAAPKYLRARILEAELLVVTNRRDEALSSYRKALEIYPKSVSAHVGATSLLIQQGKLDEAGKQLALLKQSAPKRAETHFLQAHYDFVRKDVPGARQAIQQYLAAQPNNVRGLLLAAAIEFQGKAYAQAEEHLVRALSRAPNATPARRMLVANYLRSGRHQEALEALGPLLRGAGVDGDANTLALAGETYLATGNPSKAEPMFRKAAELDPDDQRKRTGLALSHLAQGRVEDAFNELEQAAANDSEGRADMALFVAAMRQRDYARAMAAVDSMEKKQPNKPSPHNLRGVVLMSKGDAPGARAAFERALQIDPTFVPAAANLARMDVRDKNWAAAEKRFAAVLAKNPKSIESLVALAEIKARQGATADEVVALINKAIAANPSAVLPRRALIGFYLAKRQSKKAVEAAQDALASLRDQPEILDLAGRAYEADGANNQALVMYGKWAKADPKSPAPLVRTAQVQIKEKNMEGASATIRKALELKPDALDAQRLSILVDLKQNQMSRAIETARTVQKQRPKESVGYLMEGDVHTAAKAPDRAIAAYRAGLKQVDSADLAIRLHKALRSAKSPDAAQFASDRLKTHPKETAFRIHMAESALAANDYANSVTHYKVLVDAQPENAIWLNNLAYASARLKDPNALQYAEKAAKLQPQNPAILDTLGTLLVERGDTARGIDLLRKAAAMPPQMPNIRLNLAKSLISAGHNADAKKELEELQKMGAKNPQQAEVERLLKTL